MNVFEEHGVEAIVVNGATNRRYYSGWSADDHAPDRPTGVMLITPSEKMLFATPTNLPWAEAEVLPDVSTHTLTVDWPAHLARVINDRRFTRIGFEDTLLSVAAWRELAGALEASATLVPLGDGIDQLRQRKTARELGLIRDAIALTDEAFEKSAASLHVGQTERELSLIVDDNLRQLGSEGRAFDTIVASGPNAARPHHSPGSRAIEEGDPVIIDMGARVEGYCGDLTRTIWMGQAGDQLGTMYRLVADAQRAAISAVKPGIDASAIDKAARDVFAEAGLEEHFRHSVGHGLGLRIHEAPFLREDSPDVLRANYVVTIEPGLYIPGWGGVRIEDVVIVTGDGCENLTRSPKRLGQ